MNSFFVVGCPRSGTTMLQQALNRHSQIVVPPETAFLFLLDAPRSDQRTRLAQINAELGIDLNFPRQGVTRHGARALYEEMAESYLHHAGRAGVTHFGEKTPQHQLRLHELMQLFPAAKILLIYRDGRDVALSLTKTPWLFSPDLYANFALWLHYQHKHSQALISRPKNLYCVKYETLVAQPETEIRKLLMFLGLPYEAQVVNGSGDSGGVLEKEHGWKESAFQPITQASMGKWRRELTELQISRIETWGRTALKSLGYELLTDRKTRLPAAFLPFLYGKIILRLAKQPRSRLAREAWRNVVHFLT